MRQNPPSCKKQNMDAAKYFYKLGKSAMSKDEFKKAIEYFSGAIKVDDNNPNYYLERCFAY